MSRPTRRRHPLLRAAGRAVDTLSMIDTATSHLFTARSTGSALRDVFKAFGL